MLDLFWVFISSFNFCLFEIFPTAPVIAIFTRLFNNNDSAVDLCAMQKNSCHSIFTRVTCIDRKGLAAL